MGITKEIRLLMDKLGRKIIKEFVALRPKMYDHLTDNICVDKNAA